MLPLPRAPCPTTSFLSAATHLRFPAVRRSVQSVVRRRFQRESRPYVPGHLKVRNSNPSLGHCLTLGCPPCTAARPSDSTRPVQLPDSIRELSLTPLLHLNTPLKSPGMAPRSAVALPSYQIASDVLGPITSHNRHIVARVPLPLSCHESDSPGCHQNARKPLE